MSNYTKTTDFGAKDSLPTGDSGKIIRGTEFETEFDAISTAIATKADIAGPTFTGTLTYETISDGTISITAFVDEDDMSSNSANLVPTQQSVKAYVDAVTTELQAQDLDFQADTGGALSIDLDSESLTFTGGTGIDTSGSGNAVTFAIDSTVATLTGTQTLTNKTLTSPDVNTPDIDGGTIDGTVIGGTTPAAVSATTVSATGNITVNGTVDGRDVATDGSKLDGIEAGATADQTAAEIRTLVEAATDSNVFTDADHSKLDGIEAGATGDQTNAEIRAAVEAATDSNVFTDADHSKLDGIEALADVTDTTNVTAAGALMDSELTNITAVKALNQGVATTDTPTFAGLATSANVTFGDNDKAIFGASSDLQIYHDSNNSYIKDAGTGYLILGGQDTGVAVQNGSGQNLILTGANAVTLSYGSASKLATTSTGIDVTGSVVADSYDIGALGTLGSVATDRLFIATADGLGLQFDFDNSRIVPVGADGSTYNNNVSLGASGLEFKNLFLSGTVTAGGLTVDGASGELFFSATGSGSYGQPAAFSTASNGDKLKLYDDDSSYEGTIGVGNASNMWFKSYNSTGSAGKIEFYTGSNKAAVIEANNDISFYEDTGTTPKFFWDSSAESLGIGTSSPSSFNQVGADTLVVGSGSGEQGITIYSGTANNGVLAFADGTTTTQQYQGYIGYNHSSNFMRFFTSATEAMRIDASGNVGIGTSSPLYRLHTQMPSDGSAGAAFRYIGGTNNPGLFLSVNESTRDVVLNASGSTSANLVFSTTDERMRIDSSGNVGIGTSNPDTRLQVQTTHTSTDVTAANSNSTLNLGNAGSGNSVYNAIKFSGNQQDMYIMSFNNTAQANRRMGFFLGSVAGDATTDERLSITGSGNVGIGTSSPNDKVDISGSTGDGYRLTDGTHTGVYRSISGGTILKTTSNHALLFGTNDTERMRIDSSGNLLVGTTDTDTQNNNAGSTADNGFVYNRGSGGYLNVARYGGTVAYFNRTSTDGAIVDFRKDGSTVGSISVGTSDLLIGKADTQDCFLRFGTGGSAITLCDSDGLNSNDGLVDLGQSNYRFKDLYLSGGIHANNAFQRWKVVDNNGGSGIFSTITNGEPQTGFLYAYETGTTKYIIAALFKQDESSVVITTQIANNGLTVNATNSGGTIALAGATTTSNVRMQAVTIKRS